MRLVNADALIQSLEKKHEHWHELVPEENKEIEFAHSYALNVIRNAPTADAKPTVIQSKTLFPTKDFMEWAKRIKEVNPNAVVIPCDAEVASAEAEPSLKAIKRQIDEHWYLDPPSAEAVQGEWKRVPTRTYKGECTNCGFRHIFMDGHDSQYRFCPNCGARMKGAEHEIG